MIRQVLGFVVTWAAPFKKRVLSGQDLRMEHRGAFLFDTTCSLRAIQDLEHSMLPSVYIAAFSALSVLNKFL